MQDEVFILYSGFIYCFPVDAQTCLTSIDYLNLPAFHNQKVHHEPLPTHSQELVHCHLCPDFNFELNFKGLLLTLLSCCVLGPLPKSSAGRANFF